MTTSELYTILTSIDGFENKVAYSHFPVGHVPDLPYICYLETQTDNFFADNKVYEKIQGIDIELYCKIKDPAVESLIESALNNNSLGWNKFEDYIEQEEVYEITYELEV